MATEKTVETDKIFRVDMAAIRWEVEYAATKAMRLELARQFHEQFGYILDISEGEVELVYPYFSSFDLDIPGYIVERDDA